MPRLSTEEHMARKKACALDFTVKKDAKGKVLNPEVVSVTSQSFKDECDVNIIIKRGIKDGFLVDPLKVRREPRYGDFTDVPSFQESLNRINQMRDEFAALPAETRAFFNNNPAELIAFIQDPKNEDKAVELGVLNAPKIHWSKESTPEGEFWVKFKNDKEIERKPVALNK